MDIRIQFGIEYGKERGIIVPGDVLVLMNGWRQGAGFTNTLRLVFASESFPWVYPHRVPKEVPSDTVGGDARSSSIHQQRSFLGDGRVSQGSHGQSTVSKQFSRIQSDSQIGQPSEKGKDSSVVETASMQRSVSSTRVSGVETVANADLGSVNKSQAQLQHNDLDLNETTMKTEEINEKSSLNKQSIKSKDEHGSLKTMELSSD